MGSPDEIRDKEARLDVLVRLSDGTRIDVEMQNRARAGHRARALFYWARIFDSQLAAGQDHDQLRRCVAIWIQGFQDLKGDQFHTRFLVLETATHQKYTDELELHIVELPKLPESGAEGDQSDLVRWCRFLAADSARELEEASMNDPELREAWEEVKRLNADPETREHARARADALLMGRHTEAAARAEGKAEGEARGRAETLVEMLEDSGLVVSAEQRERILGCQEVETLRRWLRKARTAGTVEAVFE